MTSHHRWQLDQALTRLRIRLFGLKSDSAFTPRDLGTIPLSAARRHSLIKAVREQRQRQGELT